MPRIHQPGWDDELVDDKYRVFYGPGSHIGVTAYYEGLAVNPRNPSGNKLYLREVDGFVFVLRPEVDEAALVALAAYATAVRSTKPALASDLMSLVNEWL